VGRWSRDRPSEPRGQGSALGLAFPFGGPSPFTVGRSPSAWRKAAGGAGAERGEGSRVLP